MKTFATLILSLALGAVTVSFAAQNAPKTTAPAASTPATQAQQGTKKHKHHKKAANANANSNAPASTSSSTPSKPAAAPSK